MNVRKMLVRWAIIAVALVTAAWIVPGIDVEKSSGWIAVLVMAAVLGLVNAVVRPVLRLLALPIIVLTIGLFLLVINAFTLWLSSWIAVNALDAGFYVKGFFPALLGGIVVSIVSTVLSAILPD